MKLLIVDLYNDGDILRIIEDTPENRAHVAAFDKQDREYVRRDGQGEHEQFSEFMQKRGVPIFEHATIGL